MNQDLLQLRKLTVKDFPLVQAMETSIENDYVLNIFPELVESETNAVYGLFTNDILVAIAGYSIFLGGYAMLGRLRSDKRFISKGYATKILHLIKGELEKDPSIKWIGANTNEGNLPARRVLQKLEFSEITKLHSITVKDKSQLNGRNGMTWDKVESLHQKRNLLNELTTNSLGVYPYECYYPFPYTEQLVSDDHLKKSSFYQNPTKDRLLIIKNDHKHEWFAHVKYFWNDHFKQPGFWNTIEQYIQEQAIPLKAWVDFSPEGYHSIPNIDAFDDSDPWILYGNPQKTRKR